MSCIKRWCTRSPAVRRIPILFLEKKKNRLRRGQALRPKIKSHGSCDLAGAFELQPRSDESLLPSFSSEKRDSIERKKRMQALMESIREYPQWYAVLGGAVALCLFAWSRALRAAKKRQGRRTALIAALEHEKALRQEFAQVTPAMLRETDAERLTEGLCCKVQMALEQAPALREAYDALPEPQRLLYALGYVVQDGREALSGFFRKNGPPLTDDALRAVLLLCGAEDCDVFARMHAMFDEENERVSLTREAVQALDERWAALAGEQDGARYAGAKDYAIVHSGLFLDPLQSNSAQGAKEEEQPCNR
jgi:hypothetical protein